MTDSDQAKINLNPPALRPSADEPWHDDALQRQAIAAELDKLVAELVGGAEPATIALDGGYGTGKTFILERWVQEMVGRGQVAMYYNAWENDCDDDPLVSLMEVIASNDKTNWGERLAPALSIALNGILQKYTGIDAQKTWTAGNDQTVGLLDAARHRRKSRNKLKAMLTELVEATGNGASGVVVVIDELDRCRPTFATELMERVKHVLNVRGLVFVFGVNMTALQETVKTVYGDIDAHQYLLRMFTTSPLRMPPGVAFLDRSSDPYLEALIDRHGLRAFCRDRSLEGNLNGSLFLLGLVAAGGGLTPREFGRVVLLLAEAAKTSIDRDEPAMLADVLVPLAIARVKDPDAYYRTVSRTDEATAVINCFFGLIREANLYSLELERVDTLEMTMYRICHLPRPPNHNSEPPACLTLSRLAGEEEVEDSERRHLSHRSAYATRERAKALLEGDPEGQQGHPMRGALTFNRLRSITSCFDVVWPRHQAW